MLSVATLKTLLGISASDDTKDSVLAFTLQEATEVILNYCNIDTLPPGLENTAYRMAIDLYRHLNLGAEEGKQVVVSIKEGDTTVQSKEDTTLQGGVLGSYKAQLNRYRRVAFQ